MSPSGKRELTPQNLRLLLFGWLGLSAVAAICVFVVVLAILGKGGSAGVAARPTTRPVVAPTTPAAILPVSPTAPVDLTPQIIQDTGVFGLGGQIQPYLEFAHKDQMVQAGMSWVKYQIVWTPDAKPKDARDLIEFAHQNGFKVLLSIKGELNPSKINYKAYLSYIDRLFSTTYLPDAIEIWNEMNFDKEWPATDINGASYVNNMLAPAYQIIKSKSDTIVITGAPTPTGAFGGSCGQIDTGVSTVYGCDDNYYLQQMRDAGAANYADCIGVHFNSGATSPTATTGHPNDNGTGHYSWYYQPMVDLYYGVFNKPLCFTELGYVSSEGFGTPPVNFPWATQLKVAQQAQWLGETVSLASKSGKVRLIMVWNLDFPSDAPDDPKSMYAIVRPDGSCPACSSLRTAVSAP